MTEPGFDWRSPEQREDPLRLSVRSATELLTLPQADPIAPTLEAAEARFFERAPHAQRALAQPVLEAARLERQDAAQHTERRAALQGRAEELRATLPDGALDAAHEREAQRRNPALPAHFATPPHHRAPGARASAQDWVGLYAYEMHGQQQLGGARGIEGRAAAAIQRRAATGLKDAYRDLPPEGRAEGFGGQLAALAEWPLGGQVSQAVLARLPAGERARVQAALMGAQRQRRDLGSQDARALELQGLEGQLAQGVAPLAERLPAGLPADVRRQVQLGMNAGPGAFEAAGSAMDGAAQITARSRGERTGSVPALPQADGVGAPKGRRAPKKAPAGAKRATRAKDDPKGKAKKAPANAKAEKGKGKTTAKAKGKAAGAKAPKANGKAPTAGARAKGAAPRAGKGAALPTPGAGGGAAGGPQALRAVPLAEMPKGISAKPVLQVDGTAFYDLGQWKQLEAQEAQQARQVHVGTATRTGASAPQAAPRASTAHPLKQVGRTVSAAQIKAAEAAERKAAEGEMHAFVTRSQAKIKALDGARRAVAPTVQAAAKGAQAKVAGAARTATAQLASAAASATAKAQAAAASARTKIQAEFSSTTSAIKAATRSNQAALNAQHTAAVSALAKGLTSLNSGVSSAFTAAQGRAHTIGQSVGGAALAKGNQRAAAYAAEPLPHQSGWDNFVNGKDYPAKKRQAKVDAARQVGQSYHDELIKHAEEYAAKIPEGQAQVTDGNQKLHDEYLKTLDQQHTDSVTALHDAETQFIQQATTTRDQQLQAVAQQLRQAVAGINRQHTALKGQVQQQSSSQQAAISKAAASSISGLQKAADTATSGLHKQVSGIQGQLKGKGVPDVQALKAQLGTADQEIAGGVAAAQQSITGGARTASAQLNGQAGSAAAALAGTASQGAQGMNQAGAQAASAAAQVATGAAQALKGLAKGHEAALKALTEKVKSGTQSIQKGFDADAKSVTTGVRDQLKQAGDTFQGDLTKGMADEDAKITEEANKAADKVQPRWKGWVSIVIDIVIAIAVTALVICTGGVAGVVLGIVAGAVGGVLGQLAKDGLNGEMSSWQTYAAAALGGAIGGAVGAGGGALSGKLAGMAGEKLLAMGAGKVASGAVKFGVDFVGNNITGLVGQAVSGFINNKAFGTPFSLSDVFSVKNIAQNALMTGVGSAAGKYFEHNPGVVNRMRGMAGFGPKPQVHVTASPEHAAAAPEGAGTHAPTGKTEGAPTTPKGSTEAPRAPTTGREAPVPPATREAPAQSAAPRTTEIPAPHRSKAPGAPEGRGNTTPRAGGSETTRSAGDRTTEGQTRNTAPEGNARGEGQSPEPIAARHPEGAPGTGGKPDVSEQFRTNTFERNGRTYVETTGRLGQPGEVQTHRDPSAQARVSRGTGDDAGHRIGDRFGAPGDESNLAQQNWRANRNGTFKQLENRWAAALKDGVQIEAKVTDITRAGETRPFMRRAEWTETHPDGSVTHHELDFANTHTPESRSKQNIPDTVSEPQANNVTHVDFRNRRVIEGPQGPTPPEGSAPTRPGKAEGRNEGAPETATGDTPETVSARNRRSDDPDLNPTSVADLPGTVSGTYDYTNPGPLSPDKAATFAGQRYRTVKLEQDLVLYRVGEEGKPLGQFFDTKAPMSEIQARIDKAVLPRWPGGGESPIQMVHEVRVPAGTDIHVGEVANQGEYYLGGTRQVVVIEPWKIPGLEVLSSKPVNRIEVQPAIPAERVGDVQPLIERAQATPPTVDGAGPPTPQGGEGAPPVSAGPKSVTAEELAAGLPAHLRDRVPVEVHADLPSNTVRVRYEAENGVIKAVKLEAGPQATPRDIELHAQTVQAMQKYMGLQGRVRAALDRLMRLVGLDGTPKVGTRAWEAHLELQKLDGIIQERQAALAGSDDAATRSRLEADIQHLEQQLATHEATLGRMDLNPGEGYVAADGIRNGTHPNTLEFNFDQIRKDLFGKKGRPGWSEDTKQTLKSEYPSMHDADTTNLVPGNDRRHIIAFDYLVNQYVRELNGRQISEIAETLRTAGYEPESLAIADVSTSLKAVLKEKFNEPKNLFPEDATENQRKGREGYQAEQRRARAKLAGDLTTFELESRIMSAHYTDVPEGQVNGQALGETETDFITNFDNVEANLPSYEALEGKTAGIRAGMQRPSRLYRDARADLINIEEGLAHLAEFSKGGNQASNDAIRAAIEKGMRCAIRLSELLNQ